MTHDEVIQLVKATLEFASLSYKRSFAMPEIRFDASGGLAGQVRDESEGDIVRFNPAFMDEPDFDTTVKHEVAHYVQRRLWPKTAWHGPEWASVMRRFGLPPNVHHHYSMASQGRHEYTCKCGTVHWLTDYKHSRQKEKPVYYCRRCKAYIWEKVKLVKSPSGDTYRVMPDGSLMAYEGG